VDEDPEEGPDAEPLGPDEGNPAQPEEDVLGDPMLAASENGFFDMGSGKGGSSSIGKGGSSSSSSGQRGTRQHRIEATKVIPVPGGFISWHAEDKLMKAHCDRHKSVGCTKIRTCKPEAKSSAKSRPIGVLMAYLAAEQAWSQADTSSSHHRLFKDPPLALRQALREKFKTLPGSEYFLTKEREVAKNEAEEPLKAA
jgi:hypothetical protein